jgi:hypothetical protein
MTEVFGATLLADTEIKVGLLFHISIIAESTGHLLIGVLDVMQLAKAFLKQQRWMIPRSER